jgi:flagellar assembly protein FliH
LLADSPKDNRFSPSDACALYYFPEIPSGPEKSRADVSPQGRFVGGTFNRTEPNASTEAERLDPEQVQSLVEEAFNNGVEQGRAEMAAAQQAKVDKAAAAFEAGVREMMRVRRQDVERMETETVRLALAIAKKIIGHETSHGEVIGQVVRAAMEKVTDPRHLVLRLNPEDVDMVNGFKGELLPEEDFGSDLRIEADEGIQRGGCIIETHLGDVDARIENQIKIVEAQLIDLLPKRLPQG